MPGYELELTIGCPRRPSSQPFSSWRWTILVRIRRALRRLDFDDDGLRCGVGFGDELYVAYRDRFAASDERSHLTFCGPDGHMRQTPIPHGVYAVRRVVEDLDSAQVTFVDDDRLAVGSTHRGVRALAHAFLTHLEEAESATDQCGGRSPARRRSSTAERWLPGRDIRMITDEGDAFLKEGSCLPAAQLARLTADDLGQEDERAAALRSLAEALEATQSAPSHPPPAVAVSLTEIAAAELLIDQIRLRSQLPARLVRHCLDCGARAPERRADSACRRDTISGSTAGIVSPVLVLARPGNGTEPDVSTLGPVAEHTSETDCLRCRGRRSAREPVALCPACAAALPDGLLQNCPRCRTKLTAGSPAVAYYWFSAPTWTDRNVREFQPGADPREAIRR